MSSPEENSSSSISVGYPLNEGGHNNAIYCELGTNSDVQEFMCYIYTIFDNAQSKNKAWIRFVPTGNPRRKPLPENAVTTGTSSINLYWQVQDSSGKDLCTIGETLQGAKSTSALVLGQGTDSSLPSQ